ncbi:MAG: pentapeptide repeat-containing protein [Gammaproteobacteria bacterium]
MKNQSRKTTTPCFILWVIASFLAWPALSQQPKQPEPASTQPPGSQNVIFKSAVQRTLQGELPFSCPNCDLSGMDFSGRDLTNANLAGANLIKTNFSNAILNGAILTKANLTGANLDGAHLNKSNRGPVSLALATLDGATLRQAQMEGADLQFASMKDADFSGSAVLEAITGAKDDVVSQIAATDTIACGAADLSSVTSRIFVSPNGTDSDSCGASVANACKTIAKGIARCSGSGCGVLVEWAQYNLTASLQLRNGVNVYGGCIFSGQPQPGLASVINAPGGGQAAVQASQISSPTIFQGFKLIGMTAAGTNGAASNTFLVSNSSSLAVLNTEIVAGNGAAGNKGDGGLPGAPGGDASGRIGGAVPNNPSGGLNYCSDSTGGNGGAARHVSVKTNFWGNGTCTPSCEGGNSCYGASGSPGSTGSWVTGGNHGYDRCVNCLVTSAGKGDTGNAGINAACGAGGVASSDQAGRFSGSVWSPGSGGSGQPGGDASGGGGGGSGGYHGVNCFGAIENTGGQGGGAGAGGCGGQGGKGGQQGGGSFAMAVINSAIRFDKTRVIGGMGGTGGMGGGSGHGGTSGKGASGSSGACTVGTCAGTGADGKNGGIGGSGGGGAGGNGGPAVGIAVVAGSTVTGDVVYYAGAPGLPGQPGKGSATPSNCTSPDGAGGLAGLVSDMRQY